MKYLQRLISRKFYRSALFWALSLTLIYSLAGFFLLPNIIHNMLVEQVKQQLGWKAEIGKIEFNPYVFTLTIHNVKIVDLQAQKQLSFSRYHMDFELRSIIEGAFTFADIELYSPIIKIEIDQNGITNFQHAQQLQQAKRAHQGENKLHKNTDNTLPKLLFDNIHVIAGKVNIVDHSPVKTVKYQLNPITFNLKNFLTNGSKESYYQLNIALGNEQTINWNGTIAIAPLRSHGSLKITGIKIHEFWDYLSDQTPYTLKHAILGFSGQYDINMAGDSAQFNIQHGVIKINDIKLANKQQEESFVEIQTAEIAPLDFNLAEKKLKIGTAKIDAVSLKLTRNKQGLLNILAPFVSIEPETKIINKLKTKRAVTGIPFQWSINDFILNNSQVNFIDKEPTENVQLSVNKINFNVQELSQDLSKKLPFKLTYYTDHSSKNSVVGKTTIVPLNLQAHLTLSDFALPTLQPYINHFARVNLERGKLSVTGDLNLNKNTHGQIQGDFQGVVNINEFNSKDQALKQHLIGWQALNVNPIKINFNPLSIAVSNIGLTKPYVRLIVGENREVNLVQLAVNKNSQKSKEITDSTNTKEKPLVIKIDKITVKDGGAYFADLSLQPHFGTSIQDMNGEISGLSSDNLERANVNITGNIEEYGKMLIQGQINPFAGDLYTDLNADFDKIELSTLTPYSGRYTGYAIDKGKLSLQLNYKIANNLLDANNHLILDQFELGSAVDSDESLDLPFKLAIALFKDSNGIIDLNLPTKGDMNDPDFAISGLVMKALFNVITKAVTSPFSMIANLVGGDADKLNSIAFNFGSATLTSANINQLNMLAKVLNKRPKLILEIRAFVDPERDGLVLKQKKLEAQLAKAGADNVEQQKRIAVMEQLFVQQNGKKALMKLQKDIQVEVRDEGITEALVIKEDSKKGNEQQPEISKYEQSLYQTLSVKQPLSNLELSSLAQQRVSIIKAQLIKKGKVANKQVFALNSSLEGLAQENTISTIFMLTTD